MSKWTLTNMARADFSDILLYTRESWGDDQAERYLAILLDGLDLLAQRPGIGRMCAQLIPGLRRFEVGKHVIFYKPDSHGILVSRILHQNRLPTGPQFMGT